MIAPPTDILQLADQTRVGNARAATRSRMVEGHLAPFKEVPAGRVVQRERVNFTLDGTANQNSGDEESASRTSDRLPARPPTLSVRIVDSTFGSDLRPSNVERVRPCIASTISKIDSGARYFYAQDLITGIRTHRRRHWDRGQSLSLVVSISPSEACVPVQSLRDKTEVLSKSESAIADSPLALNHLAGDDVTLNGP
ncbi:hypothetical protein B0H10DRAFT_1944371 [Mycena sp. CBHHK59/15]|nr:hypothetical protein B0H10DRAFT_1944371 [Mycena sp. CBHHK59/15]